ncbi:MAG TPA: NAD(P)/FAD-dependent oxidoreductase [Candidatus Korarchaeota archaeon]|nr:NAD(P)/FAD-dependent oxidoreductase [Candidatus Korarchaeota archaeon]
MYDVTVVGAGPTGTALSYFLTLRGFKVLTLERDPVPGLRTICGEYLPDPNSLQMDGDVGSAYFSFFKPFILHRMSRVVMEIGRRRFSADFTGYSVDRKLMIRERLRESMEGGADLRVGEAFISYVRRSEGFEIMTSKGRYESRYLVGADGFESRVARIFGIRWEMRCDDVALAFADEVNIRLDDPDEMRLIINERLAPGTYAWVIPRSPQRANVGVGVRLNMKEKFDPRSALQDLFRMLGVEGNPKVRGRYVPAGGMPRRVAQGNVFLVGDSAGMTIPSNGGGMHTGILAAYLLSRSLDDENPIESYLRKVERIIKPMVDIGLVHRRAADFLMRTGLLWRTVDLLPEAIVREVIEVEKGVYYPILKALSILYGLVVGRVGSYPAC